MDWRTFGLVFLGGGLGSCARFGLSGLLMGLFGRLAGGLPIGTMIVNISGCLAIGLAAGLFSGNGFGMIAMPPLWRALLVVGFLGGFTTFSAFEFESFQLAMQGHWLRLALNVAGSVLLGWLAVAAGFWLARGFAGVLPSGDV